MRIISTIMWSLFQDLRMGIRLLMRRPRFTLPMLGSFALAIGASTAVFSIVNAVLLRPPTYPEPNRLVTIWDLDRLQNPDPIPIEEGVLRMIQKAASSFEEIAGFTRWEPVIRDQGRLRSLHAATCTAELFRALAVKPLLGRVFLPTEDEMPGATVVVLSYSFWQEQFGADPGIIGRLLTLEVDGRDQAYTIVGVMPQGFEFPYPELPDQPEFWEPYVYSPFLPNAWDHNVYGIGRLKPGISLRQAQEQMDSIARDLDQAFPQAREGTTLRLLRLQRAIDGGVRPMLLLLFIAVGFVVLIGCANAANLTSALAQARREQLAVRRALGAGTARLMQQALAETAVVGLAGCALGVVAARALLPWLVSLVPHHVSVPGLHDAHVDWRVLGFALVLTLACAAMTAILPAWRVARQNLSESVKGNLAVEQEYRPAARSGRFLVAGEVALSIGLLVGAGLLLKTFFNLARVDYGFDPGHLLDIGMDYHNGFSSPDQDHSGTAPPPQINLIRQIQQRVLALPGVKAVGMAESFPLQDLELIFMTMGQRRSEALSQRAELHFVTPGYFRLMHISAIRGRLLAESDDLGHPPAVVINDAMASKYWPGSDPIGQRLTTRPLFSIEPPWYTIVGVVRDANRVGLNTAPKPAIYTTFYQTPIFHFHLLVDTSIPSQVMAGTVRGATISAAGPDVVVGGSVTGAEIFEESIYRTRFSMLMLSFYGTIALLLAVGGIYSVNSFTVARRTHEMGVRIALGARPGDIVLMVLSQELRPAAAGIVVGLVAARTLDRALSSLLFGVGLTDPSVFLAASLLALLAAVAASYVPARLAARVDPAMSLRAE